MRQPLEDRKITIARSAMTVEYPASFMLVASMNPCPCGYYNHPEKDCVCAPGAVQKYLNKISGPLLDRIDIQIEIVPVPFKDLSSKKVCEKSEVIRERVIKARKIQQERFKNEPAVYCNAQMNTRLLNEYVVLDETCKSILQRAVDMLKLSARAYDRILKVSRTIADLEGSDKVLPKHVSEAVTYRNLDRENWAG
jgi:magnesium chelatase family protein